ncbi:class I SAM-dependent methyltransferase [Larsenimonas suaedae]|uniref:Class I SAM-dependent methyltransferase n=1 Tax=Larsenimonas suaedae TaxID=1851019 RepID=A0ABU1GTE5_9GAMM|nr:class I SAM-dependent methyltransferase [Larsenimonas suaedae]MCM2971702.1 class I SAM-dependent methyltransferase [Larsenimonas suaedae]MDR5895254.1 class I SAM-dependent methyltransferase [Larsenimonas suaedae]
MTTPYQMAKGSQFETDWLALREPADHHARDNGLSDALKQALPFSPLTVTDLGAGRGSNLRFLAPKLTGAQHWHLVDHDPALLEAARLHPAPIAELTLTTQTASITDPAAVIASDTHLVTASALLDLVSDDWLSRLADYMMRHAQVGLFALSVDGHFSIDARPDSDNDHDVLEAMDQTMAQLINDHQRQERGLGTACGPDGWSCASQHFERAGYRVTVHDTPWRIHREVGISAQPLGERLLRERVAAAREIAPKSLHSQLEHWYSRRLTQFQAGHATIVVGHKDLLVVPAPDKATA